MLRTALMQRFASLSGRCLETERVLVVIFVADAQHEVTPFEMDLDNPRPEIVADFGLVAEDDDAAWSKAQEIFDGIFTQDWMQVGTVEIEPFNSI